MKKYRYIGQILMLVTLLIYTQTLSAQMPIKYGVKFGGNFSNFSGKGSSGALTKFTGTLGAFVNHSVNDMFGVQAELLYIRKGARYVQGANSTLVYKFDYLEIPVLAKIMKTFQDQVFYGLAGPQFDIKLKSTTGFTGGKSPLSLVPAASLKSSDFGITLGLGTATTDQKLFGEVRFSRGLTKIVKGGTVVNEVWSVLFGTTF
jgi:hypothetical protein